MRSIWLNENSCLSPLSGKTGGSFCLHTPSGKRYVLRTQTPELARKGVNRQREAKILRNLTALSPQVPKVRYETPEFLLLDWCQGSPIDTWNEQRLGQLACFLRRLHRLPINDLPHLDLNEYRMQFIAQLASSQQAQWLAQKPVIPSNAELAITHLDLNSQNILWHKNALTVIDWEYAFVADPAFDIAQFLLTNHLSRPHKQFFLQAYLLGQSLPSQTHFHQRLQDYLSVADYLNRLWAAI